LIGVVLFLRRRGKRVLQSTVSQQSAPQQLVVTQGSANLPALALQPGKLFIGRSATNALALNDQQASRQHARLDFVNGSWVITDLNSSNGVYLNGLRITRHPIYVGDTIQIGNTRLKAQ
jgi:pSer/pThr/pTyr-binding forkhead associated (FHA) protein